MRQNLSTIPVTVLDTSGAWGYHSPNDFGLIKRKRLFRHFIYFHNGLNAASIVVSPLAGLIRIVMALFLLHKVGKMKQRTSIINLAAAKRFLKMEAGRGVMELFFLGIILGTLVDGVMTCKRKNLCCFE